MTPDESRQLTKILDTLQDMHHKLFDPEKGILDRVKSIERRHVNLVGFTWLWVVLSFLYVIWHSMRRTHS